MKPVSYFPASMHSPDQPLRQRFFWTAQHTPRTVVGWAGSHVHNPVYYQRRSVLANARGRAVAAAADHLRYRHAVVWVGCRNRWPDCSNTASRALVARLAHHFARATCTFSYPRRIPGAALRWGIYEEELHPAELRPLRCHPPLPGLQQRQGASPDPTQFAKCYPHLYSEPQPGTCIFHTPACSYRHPLALSDPAPASHAYPCAIPPREPCRNQPSECI